MPASSLRDHIGIAIDGGGVRGAIVAQGLIELEQMLGVERLIDSPRVNVIAGTSTGSLIATGIAAGLSGAQILTLYQTLSKRVFAKAGPLQPFGATIPLVSRVHVPRRVQRGIGKIPLGIGELLLYALFPARYAFDPLRALLHDTLAAHPLPSADPTLGEVGAHLRATTHGPTVIITATEVAARRTHFLKTTPQERYPHMKLVDALLASSSIPTYFPPIRLPDGGTEAHWLIDGGVGNFGNPALVVAWELCDPRNPDITRRYDPAHTTLFSFGTGTTARDTYRRAYGSPTRWWALEWVQRMLDIFVDSAIRQQSRSLVYTYAGIDLRRFQVELPRPVDPDEFDLMDTLLWDKGQELRQLMRDNRHALHPDPALRHDPEGIWHEIIEGYVLP